jgi:rubrerythrin
VSTEIRQLEQMIGVVARMIPAEQRSIEVYRGVAAKATRERWRLLFDHLAEQEQQHLDKLTATLEILQAERRELKH